VLRSAIALYSGFLFNTLTWRSLSLSMNITYRLGFYFRKPALRYSSLFNGTGLHADYAIRWKSPGDEQYTTVPSMRYPVPSEVSQRDVFYSGSEVHVKRGDNIRLNDARFDWRFSFSNGNHKLIKSGQLFLYVNNLNVILWKKYKGRLDADYSGGASAISSPPPRSFQLGFRVTI